MTYGAFIDDVLVALGMVHDDSLWIRNNILLNTIYGENLLETQGLARDLGPAGDVRSASRNLSAVVVPITYNAAPSDVEWAHLYFDLPSQVYDLPHDGGVSFIRYHRPSLPVNCRPSVAGATFTMTTLSSLSSVWDHRKKYPREDRPYVARARSGDADRVYLFGVSPLITKVLVGLYAVPSFDTVLFTDEMQIDPHRLHDLKRLVLNMAIWPLGMPQERLKNDGRDFEPNQVVNMRPIVGVNDPILNSNIEG